MEFVSRAREASSLASLGQGFVEGEPAPSFWLYLMLSDQGLKAFCEK
jgi:hypothetical protein